MIFQMAPNKQSKKARKFVKVTNRAYGNALKGVRIYWEGKRPKALKDDGRIGFGKHVLEQLTKRFGKKFRWILTQDNDSVVTERGIAYVRMSSATIARVNSESFARTRDIKNDIITRTLASLYPSYFTGKPRSVFVPGSVAALITKGIVPKLSASDRKALNEFLPSYLASESVAAVNLVKAAAEIQSLTELAHTMEEAMGETKGESWWQTFIRANILLIQQGYIMAIEKMNTAIGGTKYPDFSLVTHDSYLDILEIKKPTTGLLKHDEGRDNYYWDSEVSRAIIQVENYISMVTEHAPSVRSYILDTYKVDLKVVRPRGIILVGDARLLNEQKQKDDLRLLSQGLKNITVVTYDELLTRLKNYIEVLTRSAKPASAAARTMRMRRQTSKA
ncbi:MAG: Shedu immune nuclease family protein [Terracidiphilus sp.]|jgi:hypothetical protein